MRRPGSSKFAACIPASLLCVVLMATAACHRTPDEQQVRAAIASSAAAARNNDAEGVLESVSADFVGNDGELDRRGLERTLALRAFRHDSTGVLIGPVSFEHRGDRLIASFTLTLTGGKAYSLLPDQAVVYDMTTAWRREGSRWRCYGADWRQQL